MCQITNIAEKYSTIQERVENDPTIASRFWSNEYKRDREWLVLGSTVNCLKKMGLNHPIFAVETTPPLPDFKIFDSKDAEWRDLEITECIPVEWYRSKYFAETTPESPLLNIDSRSTSPEEGLDLLTKLVLAKSEISYAKTSDLIVYFDIPFYKHLGKQYPQICEIIRESERPSFPTTPFRRVYVLSAEMNDLAILK